MSDSRMITTATPLPVIALSLLAGVCFLQLQPALKGPLWTSSEILMFLPLCLWLFYRLPHYRDVFALLSGFLWALLFAQVYLHQQLPAALTGQNIVLEGVVTGLPDYSDKSVRFNFDVTQYISVNNHSGKQKNDPVNNRYSVLLKSSMPSRLRLSWYYNKGEIHSGQHWRLMVRLKPPHGVQNPGGFDYEKWLYQQAIHATGYVRKSTENQRLGKVDKGVNLIRENLLHILSGLPDPAYQGLLQALTIGHKSAIDNRQWQVLRQTGTSHLMAISGLHIGLVAGLVFFMVRRLAPAIICKYSSAPQVAALAGLAVAGFYALLAGFTIPTQRAFIMLLVMMLAILIKRPAFSMNTLSLALIAVLMINPVSVLSVGFWLSFLAVLIITVVSGARVVNQQFKIKAWLQGVRIQWLIASAMLPLSLLLFQQGSLVSPLVNMLAIPVVGLIIVPLVLLASFVSVFSIGLSIWLFTQVSELFSLVWVVLEWFAELPLSSLSHSSVPLLQSAIALLGVVLLLMPRGFPLRYSGFILLLPMLLYQPPRPEKGAFWLSVLDVGQGLSVLVQTKNKSLLYDTGAKFSERFDMGQRVVVPYLNYTGIQVLDLLMLSHGDNDHAGGADSVLQMLDVQQLLAESEIIEKKVRVGRGDKACESGQRWLWDGVYFEVLHPDQGYKKRNNRSCVLKIWNNHYSLLLSGDIESKVELRMLRSATEKLKSDILIVPHHGSNTSSTQAWLDKVDPQLAIVSAGYKNRFGHPTTKVLARYQRQGSRILNTAKSGMIQIKLPVTSGSVVKDVRLQRKVSTHYWNHRL